MLKHTLYSLCLTGYFRTAANHKPVFWQQYSVQLVYEWLLPNCSQSQAGILTEVLCTACVWMDTSELQPITGRYSDNSTLYSLCLTGCFVPESAPSAFLNSFLSLRHTNKLLRKAAPENFSVPILNNPPAWGGESDDEWNATPLLSYSLPNWPFDQLHRWIDRTIDHRRRGLISRGVEGGV